MHWCGSIVAVALFAGATVRAGESKAIRFDKKDVGKAPSGWTVAKTGKGKGSMWMVVADETAPSKKGLVLAQTAKSPNALFNLCVVKDSNFRDVEVRVAFKAIQGDADQGGGIVWRYQDANNYYVARMNPLEDNYRVYKVVAGKRTQLDTKEKLRVPVGEWHVLKIRQNGDLIECFLDNQKHLSVRDTTFTKAGQVGLWTKADAQTYFDGLEVRELKE
jgi:hypothetical protein